MPTSNLAILWLLYSLAMPCRAQGQTPESGAFPFPSRILHKIQTKTTRLDGQLDRQTEKYLDRMHRREERLYKKLFKVDSSGAKELFAHSSQYAVLSQKLQHDTAGSAQSFSGEYQANTDSLEVMLKFLPSGQAAGALTRLKTLEAKMQDAEQIKAYVRQRKQLIGQYIQQHAAAGAVLGKEYLAFNRDIYYYSQQVREYKEMLNDPDKLEKEGLRILNKLPAWQTFMKEHSRLAGLFNLPGNYGSPQTLTGLQTKDQVAALIQQQVSTAGSGGAGALQANIQSAQSQLDGYKDKLHQLGGGSGDIDMPDFKPNNQRTKAFWRRLEYGTNFQTTRNNYAFPTVSDFGLSVGYKLTDRSTVGVGASYKLGWGNGIQHISFSSEGVGLRSFVDVKIKGSFSATGGFEYNYTKPFNTVQRLERWDDWTRSGLIGVSKTVSMKSRVFKKTKVQLLWDILSYQQVPRTQAVIFRLGYGLN